MFFCCYSCCSPGMWFNYISKNIFVSIIRCMTTRGLHHDRNSGKARTAKQLYCRLVHTDQFFSYHLENGAHYSLLPPGGLGQFSMLALHKHCRDESYRNTLKIWKKPLLLKAASVSLLEREYDLAESTMLPETFIPHALQTYFASS